MGKNSGLRAIFIIFWTIGSIFWILIGALDGDFVTSVIYISIGWVILFSYLGIKDAIVKRRKLREDSSEP